MIMKKSNELIKKGVAKVPVFIQMQKCECGSTSLGMILAYYGKWVPQEDLRQYCGVSRDGANGLNIYEAAEHYGLEVKAYRTVFMKIRNEKTYPCILHWKGCHFVVLCGFRGDNAVINDPAEGRILVNMDEFAKYFSGTVFCFKKREDFVADGVRVSTVQLVKESFAKAPKSLLLTLILSLIGSILVLFRPALDRFYYDVILADNVLSLNETSISAYYADFISFPFILVASAVFFLELLSIFINESVNMRISGKQAIIGNTGYMWKVINMPVTFFYSRSAGDVHYRKQTASTIIKKLIDLVIPLLFEIVMVVFYAFLMLKYDFKLGALGLLTIGFYLLSNYYVMQKQTKYARKQSITSAQLYNTTMTASKMIETIKKGGNENSFLGKWISIYSSCSNTNVKMFETQIYAEFWASTINMLSSVLVLFIGIVYILNGKWSIGMLMAFQGFQNGCSDNLIKFNDTRKELNLIRPSIERMDDVYKYDEKEIWSERENDADEDIKGEIEVRDLSFRYYPLGQDVLKNISLKIQKGERIAIIGKSGCGKSSLIKLLMGLYIPTNGCVMYDGKELSSISKKRFNSNVQCVEQECLFFSDSIMDNIRMWDSSIDRYEVFKSAQDASINDEIQSRPNGYEYICNENASDFSGGQRQRIEIARAFVMNPKVLILDESTNALDLVNESKVLDACEKRGITCIFVTHRVSVMNRCDRILIMESGEIVEEGSPQELEKSSERYQSLIIRS